MSVGGTPGRALGEESWVNLCIAFAEPCFHKNVDSVVAMFMFSGGLPAAHSRLTAQSEAVALALDRAVLQLKGISFFQREKCLSHRHEPPPSASAPKVIPVAGLGLEK